MPLKAMWFRQFHRWNSLPFAGGEFRDVFPATEPESGQAAPSSEEVTTRWDLPLPFAGSRLQRTFLFAHPVPAGDGAESFAVLFSM